MFAIYCRAHHETSGPLCDVCREELDYGLSRLVRCPFHPNKPTCADCKVHCYQPAMREKIKQVMRFAGPRIIWRHPLLAVFHMLDGRGRK